MNRIGVIPNLEERGYLMAVRHMSKAKIVEIKSPHPNYETQIVALNLDPWTAIDVVEEHNEIYLEKNKGLIN